MKDLTVLKYCIDHASNLNGVAIFHYTTHVVNETVKNYFLDWLGGYYKTGVSKVVISTWTTAVAAPDHPILRGVEPITCDEEIFTSEVLPEDPRRTILLTGKAKDGTSSVLSWAVERQCGGRGFVMAGMDTHKNLAIESNRRLVVNGILWAAHVEVPEGGVKCDSRRRHEIGMRMRCLALLFTAALTISAQTTGLFTDMTRAVHAILL